MLLHWRESGSIGNYAPLGPRDLPQHWFCTPRPSRLPSGFALGQSLGPRGAKSPPLGNLLGLGGCIFRYIPPLGSVRIQYIPPLYSVLIQYDIWQYSSDSMTGSISMRHSDRAANDIHEGGIVQSGPYRFSTLLSIIIIIFQHQISYPWWF